ncbi:MAG: hypothetical protein SV377_08405 [Halobacteria archaeon]|nr:hypothetical protein [Halobacteria archaeon]
MAVGSWVALTIVLAEVIGVFVLLPIYVYRELTRVFQTENTQKAAEAWYEKAVSLAKEVQTVSENKEMPVDRNRVQRRVLPLSNRLKGHARDAPRRADQTIVKRVHDVGVRCQRIGLGHPTQETVHTEVFIEEKLERLTEEAEELESKAVSRTS